MSEIKSTFTGYLGAQFQEKLFWQILTEPEFGDRLFEHLDISYFDDDSMKKLFRVIKNYYNDNNKKIPNLPNKSIYQAIAKYKNVRDITEEEVLTSIVKKIELWNDGVLNGTIVTDAEVIRTESFLFIKQQEYRKFGATITNFVATGEIKDKNIVTVIDGMFKKIDEIGDDEDYGTGVFDDAENVFKKDFREPIRTGIRAIDEATGGGLGKGEMAIILAASGVGKSTILTYLANDAVDHSEKNVLQIIFEDTPDQIKRKHYVKWTPQATLLDFDENVNDIQDHVEKKKNNIKGNLVIKRFPQEGITMPIIYQWIKRYEKKNGINFHLLILDYLDCVESHKKSPDQTQSEIAVVKYFESMAAELDIPCWTALQSNRSGFNAEWIDATQMGGSIKRAQKSHFLMSIAKTAEQQREGFANIQILKSRFAASGQVFENAIFDNNTMEIEIYNTGENKKPMKINKPSVEHHKMIEEEIETPITFDMTLLSQSRGEIEEETFSDDYDITLDNKAKAQDKLEANPK